MTFTLGSCISKSRPADESNDALEPTICPAAESCTLSALHNSTSGQIAAQLIVRHHNNHRADEPPGTSYRNFRDDSFGFEYTRAFNTRRAELSSVVSLEKMRSQIYVGLRAPFAADSYTRQSQHTALFFGGMSFNQSLERCALSCLNNGHLGKKSCGIPHR